MPWNARCSLGGNAAISQTDMSRKKVNDKISNSKEEKTSICRSENWMAVQQRATGETRRQHLHLQFRSGQLRNDKQVGAHGSLHLRLGGDFGFLERIPEHRWEGADRTPTHNTHLCRTLCSQARNVNHAFGSSNHGMYFIFVRLKRICHLVLHMSHPLLFSHLPFTTSTSSSSFTLPSPNTQEHEEYIVHHAHLTRRNQESCHKEILGNDVKIQFLVQLKPAQVKDLQFYQTRSHAVVLYNTLPAACIEKV